MSLIGLVQSRHRVILLTGCCGILLLAGIIILRLNNKGNVTSQTGTDGPPLLPQKIYYSEDNGAIGGSDTGFTIYSADTDGTNRVKFTIGNERMHVLPSKDGKYVYWTSYDNLFIENADGTEKRQVTNFNVDGTVQIIPVAVNNQNDLLLSIEPNPIPPDMWGVKGYQDPNDIKAYGIYFYDFSGNKLFYVKPYPVSTFSLNGRDTLTSYKFIGFDGKFPIYINADSGIMYELTIPKGEFVQYSSNPVQGFRNGLFDSRRQELVYYVSKPQQVLSLWHITTGEKDILYVEQRKLPAYLSNLYISPNLVNVIYGKPATGGSHLYYDYYVYNRKTTQSQLFAPGATAAFPDGISITFEFLNDDTIIYGMPDGIYQYVVSTKMTKKLIQIPADNGQFYTSESIYVNGLL